MPKNLISFNQDLLLQEVKDLVQADKVADDAADALEVAIARQNEIALEGERRKAAVAAEVEAANLAAQQVVNDARVAAGVADTLLTSQIDYLLRYISGENGLADPTPAPAIVAEVPVAEVPVVEAPVVEAPAAEAPAPAPATTEATAEAGPA